MKILWVSNAPWAATGYGMQTADVVPRLIDAGHETAVLANYGLQGAMQEWEGVRVYPAGRANYATDVISAHALHWFAGKPGLVLSLYDAWVYRKIADTFREMRFANWTPVDHSPVPPAVVDFFRKSEAIPIAMSRWGEQALAANDLEPLYVPHGTDTELFQPYDRADARRRLGLPDDKFIVGMVSTNKGRNPARKAFDIAFRSFSAFSRHHDDALLYVHANVYGSPDTIDLRVLAEHYKIDPDHLIFSDQYAIQTGIPAAAMPVLYSSFDVLSFATMGEGFGIPAIEAQACGIPVIVSDFSAQSELCGAGWRVPVQLWFDADQSADFGLPLDDFMVAALNEAYESRGDEKLSAAARDFAVGYDSRQVFDTYWLPALAELEARVTIPVEPIELP
jgi:glycosyltransferase involved in cell wall biosynthesis